MNIAFDPYDGSQITPEMFLMRWGNKTLGATEDHRPKVRCFYCDQELHHVAGRTADSHGHFAHLPKSGYCPTKEPSALPYGRLTPKNPDPQRGQWIREQALLHWKWIFYEVSKLCPNFDAYEFVELFRVADSDGLWEYRNLNLQQVPELFLVIRDFSPKSSKFRTDWFRFWFSANIREIEDLWITPPEKVRMFRARFKAPTGRQKIPDPYANTEIFECPRVGGIHDNTKVRDFAIKVIESALSIRRCAD